MHFFIFLGLTCWSCNTESPSADCIDHPEKYTDVLCKDDEQGNEKDYCYTKRLEQKNADTGEDGKFVYVSDGAMYVLSEENYQLPNSISNF